MTQPTPVNGIFSEAAWTKPSEWCPRPERWHSTDPQSTEIEVSELVAGFVRALQPDYVIETGTCLGQTSFAIGLALKQNGHGTLDTLEIEPQWAHFARGRVKGLPVNVIERPSLEFRPAGRVALLWLDSLTALRIPEFEHFRPYMNPGTLVGFHDTAPHQDNGWGDTIDDIPGVRPIRLRTPRGVTFVEVP